MTGVQCCMAGFCESYFKGQCSAYSLLLQNNEIQKGSPRSVSLRFLSCRSTNHCIGLRQLKNLKGTLLKPNASLVARQYGVNKKTVRDISRSTWKQETLPLDNKELKNGAKIGRPLEYRDSALRQQTESDAENSPQSNIHLASAGLSANSIAADDACAGTWGNITVTPEAECCENDSAYEYNILSSVARHKDEKTAARADGTADVIAIAALGETGLHSNSPITGAHLHLTGLAGFFRCKSLSARPCARCCRL